MTGADTRTPEIRLASGLFAALRRDLITDAFAYRPLPPMRTDGPIVRRLPARLRHEARHLPHLTVCLVAFFVLVSSGVDRYLEPGAFLILGLISAAPVLMTLVRPIGAFWTSTAATWALSLVELDGHMWPWSPSSFMAQLAVLVVVAMRAGPRIAAWMWAVTVGGGVLLAVVTGQGPGSIGPMALVSALALLVVSIRYVRVAAEEQVSAQQEVTAVERDRRTLLEERTTIARELHDVVAHHMSVVAIQAEAAPYRVQDAPPELVQAFATIRENAVAALTELRRVLGVVRSADYEAPEAPQPTLAALDGLLANVREAGLSVEKTVTGAVRELPQGVELSAYRIIQEALSNTLRHAPGAAAVVEVSYVLSGLGVRVANDAPTDDVRPSPGAGHGITGIRERVAMLEGEMTAGGTADGGYEVAVFIPVARADGEAA
ncbi:two-component sensor histidine kinase [Streptomyces bambusae]|uniref:histidine kinase n=2 Tax=Streptomyces bambusae TaxID=1550616 RepID=A0ABS6ZC63_9ACTN|nr:histidine kinase [Streptomyces bambusae]MBW5485336.1 two-component sensor histidine kinase [Streptomyces bambusae]